MQGAEPNTIPISCHSHAAKITSLGVLDLRLVIPNSCSLWRILWAPNLDYIEVVTACYK